MGREIGNVGSLRIGRLIRVGGCVKASKRLDWLLQLF